MSLNKIWVKTLALQGKCQMFFGTNIIQRNVQLMLKRYIISRGCTFGKMSFGKKIIWQLVLENRVFRNIFKNNSFSLLFLRSIQIQIFFHTAHHESLFCQETILGFRDRRLVYCTSTFLGNCWKSYKNNIIANFVHIQAEMPNKDFLLKITKYFKLEQWKAK